MSNPYRLPLGQRDGAVARIKKNEGFRPNIYYDSRGIPTAGYGTSLTDPDGHPWSDLETRLRDLGVNDAILQDKVEQDLNARVNAPRNSPFPVIAADEAKAGSAVYAAVDHDAPILRDKLGRDATGTYNWDKLNDDQRSALLDANYNGPKLIGERLTRVLQNQDDPAWKDKAWYELAINVADPTGRRMDEANSFTTTSFLKSPVENLLNSKDYRTGVLNTAEWALKNAMAPSNDTNASDVPNMFNSGGYRANMLNASDEEQEMAGY